MPSPTTVRHGKTALKFNSAATWRRIYTGARQHPGAGGANSRGLDDSKGQLRA